MKRERCTPLSVHRGLCFCDHFESFGEESWELSRSNCSYIWNASTQTGFVCSSKMHLAGWMNWFLCIRCCWFHVEYVCMWKGFETMTTKKKCGPKTYSVCCNHFSFATNNRSTIIVQKHTHTNTLDEKQNGKRNATRKNQFPAFQKYQKHETRFSTKHRRWKQTQTTIHVPLSMNTKF